MAKLPEQKAEQSRDKIAFDFNASPRYVQDAKKVKAYKVKIQAIDSLDIPFHKEVRNKTLEGAQEAGEALLYAEAKLGEMLKVQTSHGGSLNYKGGASKSLPSGISHKQSHFAQTIADHPEEIEEVIAEAKLGEMLKEIPKEGKTKEYGSSGGTIPYLPLEEDRLLENLPKTKFYPLAYPKSNPTLYQTVYILFFSYCLLVVTLLKFN